MTDIRAKVLEKAKQDRNFKDNLLANPLATLEKELGSKEAALAFLESIEPTGETELSEEELDNVSGGSFTSWLHSLFVGNDKFTTPTERAVAGVRG